MQTIDDIETLDALYDIVNPLSLDKVAQRLTPEYRRWIEGSRFVIVSTVGPEGTDASPRGDLGPVAHVVDPQTLWIPDWRGNNRLDTLRNIVRDGRVSLMFMVPGSKIVVRINGRAVLTADTEVTGGFEHKGISPRSVIVVTVAEVYFQCPKALMRSELWTDSDRSEDVPSAGDLLREAKDGFDGDAFDAEYPEYAKTRMW
ncbi:hypothetical protein JANAI62_33990 [Jannaschia pagri]|uniref:Pyridoxamine 5'-phosphate oxidase N-terminal domain-containing protein n=1 Tax=Jannaschia pagri TaxID=2829797 RepID=A0ABQ4NQV5_9RHOB|nr:MULTISPECIES: pyridoxamine 5'-phosphate oxidase family protein [unclassified Jannaschia]GIT92941.1 hypothetical protein JANAI61_33990 [Jannaschia sp. AI_61]GIT96776.1 hypothetical protein JANAI62_33990 [Jannaschia sp. AI_62]